MKITCTQENLYKGLSTVNHLAGKNTTLPILNNVLLKVENGSLQLSTTNLEIGIKCLIRGKIEKEGSFTVQSRLLNDYVNLLPQEAVDLEYNEGELNVSCQGFQTKIKGIDAEDFPLITSLEEKNSININLKDFKQALSQVVFAVAMDETRPEISGVLFILEGDICTMAATDSFRLAEKSIKIEEKTEKEVRIIVPYRTLQELSRVLSDNEEEQKITISWTDNQVSFSFGGIEIISRLIEGQYPDYKQIIPDNFKTEVVADKKKLIQLVKSASLFCRAGINDVHFLVDSEKNKLAVQSSNSQLGENKAEIKVEANGESNEIIFNYRYILDGLQNMDSHDVRIKIIDKHNPGLFLPEGEKGYNYIIMPIKS